MNMPNENSVTEYIKSLTGLALRLIIKDNQYDENIKRLAQKTLEQREHKNGK